MDGSGPFRCRTDDDGNGRGQQERMVPRQRCVPARTGDVAGQCDVSPGRGGAAPRAQEAKQNRRKIKELEREIRRKDKAFAETAALLVLSKKSRRSSTGTRTRTNDRPPRSPEHSPGYRHGIRGWGAVACGLRRGWEVASTGAPKEVSA